MYFVVVVVRLHQDAPAQPGGARHPARGDAAEHELDPPAEHQVSPGHPALPLLPLLSGVLIADHHFDHDDDADHHNFDHDGDDDDNDAGVP